MSVKRFRNLFLAIFIAVRLVSPSSGRAQEKGDVKSWFVEAESFFLFEEYKDALPLYQKILREEKDNFNVYYKLGVCYLNDIYNIEKAAKYLETAALHINPDYKYNTYKEKLAPPEALYYLGNAYHKTNQFDQALEKYQQFFTSADPKEFDLELVQSDIEACQRAKVAFSHPVYFRPESMGNRLNSRFDEMNPVISGDGKVLAFTRKLPFYDGVFISYKNEAGEWSPPQNLTENFETDGNNYTTGISHFGDELFIYRSDNYDGNIYHSKRIGNRWSKLEKLNGNINTKYWESSASPSPDGQYLYFTSNREGGFGGLDIYKSRKTTSGDWGVAVNMGPSVNTPANEETPFVSNEGFTLYFSSQGHTTIGGYDIFMSTLSSAGEWEKPLNMGYPLNTTRDDLNFSPTGVDAFGYISFFDPNSSEGLRDIYQVEIYNQKIPRTFTIEGQIALQSLGKAKAEQVLVKLLAQSNRKLVDQSKLTPQGYYKLSAIQGEYVLRVEVPDREAFEQSLILQVNRADSKVTIPLIDLGEEQPAEEGTKMNESVAPLPKPVTSMDVNNTYFAVTDSSAIPIELKLIKGSDLKVAVRVNGNLSKEELIEDVRKRFTYFYKPQPGENKLHFEAVDPDGNLSSVEVTVHYEPSLNQQKASELEMAATPMGEGSFQGLADRELMEYLEGLNPGEFDKLSTLYKHLMAVSAEKAFNEEQVRDLFVRIYSQKEIGQFTHDLNRELPIPDSLSKVSGSNALIPLQFLQRLELSGVVPSKDLENGLMRLILNDEGSLTQAGKTLQYHAGNVAKADSAETPATLDELWEEFFQKQGAAANAILQLAATSEELNFFYQNLLLSSDGDLHTYLSRLNLHSEAIYTSPALVKHLFDHVSPETYSLDELLNALENARINRQANVEIFHKLLIARSEGTLRSQLLLMNNATADLKTYESYLNYLLSQSPYKNYSRENVYKMLVDLIGITSTEKFAEKLMAYGYGGLNNAIADTSMRYFSSPYELVQYLVAASLSYDFTTSDLNNLLIRMILEQGLDKIQYEAFDSGKTKKFWKTREFISAIVLVNLVLILLIVLFTFRRKKE